ncbi:MAG: hypothetical protein R8P61_32250 [Bacteroidia bacterium]|nr:hypothetical protein [Bacteroidia bacterium]
MSTESKFKVSQIIDDTIEDLVIFIKIYFRTIFLFMFKQDLFIEKIESKNSLSKPYVFLTVSTLLGINAIGYFPYLLNSAPFGLSDYSGLFNKLPNLTNLSVAEVVFITLPMVLLVIAFNSFFYKNQSNKFRLGVYFIAGFQFFIAFTWLLIQIILSFPYKSILAEKGFDIIRAEFNSFSDLPGPMVILMIISSIIDLFMLYICIVIPGKVIGKLFQTPTKSKPVFIDRILQKLPILNQRNSIRLESLVSRGNRFLNSILIILTICIFIPTLSGFGFSVFKKSKQIDSISIEDILIYERLSESQWGVLGYELSKNTDSVTFNIFTNFKLPEDQIFNKIVSYNLSNDDELIRYFLNNLYLNNSGVIKIKSITFGKNSLRDQTDLPILAINNQLQPSMIKFKNNEVDQLRITTKLTKIQTNYILDNINCYDDGSAIFDLSIKLNIMQLLKFNTFENGEGLPTSILLEDDLIDIH